MLVKRHVDVPSEKLSFCLLSLLVFSKELDVMQLGSGHYSGGKVANRNN